MVETAVRRIRITSYNVCYTKLLRLTAEAVTLDQSTITPKAVNGLNGFEMQHNSNNGELYRIMYENAKEEARDYKRRYEDAISDKHKAELELAGSKNSVIRNNFV